MPRERKVSKKTCEAGKVVEVTLSFHPEAFKLVEQLRERGRDGATEALVCTGLVLEGLRARFPPAAALPLPDAPPEDACRETPAPTQLRVGMTFQEVSAVNLGDCDRADQQGPEAVNCACRVCELVGSLTCECGVAYIDHAHDNPEFSLASWKENP